MWCQYFIAALSLTCALYVVAKKTKLNTLFFIAAFLAVILYSLITLDRKFIIFIVSGLVGGFYIKNKEVVLSAKSYVIFGFLFLFMIISQMARDMLGTFLTSDDMSISAYLQDSATQVIYFIEFGDISYFYRASLESIAVLFEHGIISPGAILIRNLLIFIPSSLSFDLKPPDLSATFSLFVNGFAGGREGNMPPGFFGLFVSSFGIYWSSIFIGFIPALLNKLDSLLRNSRFLELALGCSCVMSCLLTMRGDDSSAIYIPIFFIICLKLSCLVFRFSWNKTPLFR